MGSMTAGVRTCTARSGESPFREGRAGGATGGLMPRGVSDKGGSGGTSGARKSRPMAKATTITTARENKKLKGESVLYEGRLAWRVHWSSSLPHGAGSNDVPKASLGRVRRVRGQGISRRAAGTYGRGVEPNPDGSGL